MPALSNKRRRSTISNATTRCSIRTLKTSQALLKKTTTSIQISSTAATQVKNTVSKIDSAQKALLPSLTSANIGGKVMFRAQRVYNGIAMVVSPDKISAIAALPGVKAVHPMIPKSLVTTFSDIDFLNTRPAWTTGPFGTHGENVKVADIDTGLDYIHRNFGGSGSAADYTATSDTSVVPNANYPTPKIPGGIDLVGDAYNGSNAPVPDNNPLDCNGHGTATASLITGFGETNAGFTYSGSWNATNPVISTLEDSARICAGRETLSGPRFRLRWFDQCCCRSDRMGDGPERRRKFLGSHGCDQHVARCERRLCG